MWKARVRLVRVIRVREAISWLVEMSRFARYWLKFKQKAGFGRELAAAEMKVEKTSAQSIRFVKMSKSAITPTRGSKFAAGFDLHSAENYTVPARGKALCETHIKVALPKGCYGRIAPRSGLALNHSIDVGAGVVDYDYRGQIKVVLFNFGDKEYKVKAGDKISQLICEKIIYPEIEEVEEDELDDTERGSNGFGSSGL